MNKLKVNVPEGYEIDIERSTFKEIVFKINGRKLPKTFDELLADEDFIQNHKFSNIYSDAELFSPEEAFFKLIILRDYYNDGWVADWANSEIKYSIAMYGDRVLTDYSRVCSNLLSFRTVELRYEFLKNFEDLIIDAKELL